MYELQAFYVAIGGLADDIVDLRHMNDLGPGIKDIDSVIKDFGSPINKKFRLVQTVLNEIINTFVEVHNPAAVVNMIGMGNRPSKQVSGLTVQDIRADFNVTERIENRHGHKSAEHIIAGNDACQIYYIKGFAGF